MIPSHKRVTVIYWDQGQQHTRAGYFLTNDGLVYWRADRKHTWHKVCNLDDLISVRVD